MANVLGPYTILGVVGQGATGTVYLAHQASLDRRVALKVLSPAVIDAPGFRERFAAEAQLMAAIDDANCVRVYDYFDGESPYIVAEYIEGATLREVVRHASRLSPAQSLVVLDGALAGLGRLHELQLVHRDIKPENIFCDAAGVSKLGDFGLTVSVGTVAPSMSTGSAYYMSPELVAGEPVDPRSDIYSCGATLFELLTGNPPYAGGDAIAVMRKQQKGAVPDPRKAVPDLPAEVAALVTSAMAKAPSRRPQTVADFRVLLREAAKKAYGARWRSRGSIVALTGATIAAGTAATAAVATAAAGGGGAALAAGVQAAGAQAGAAGAGSGGSATASAGSVSTSAQAVSTSAASGLGASGGSTASGSGGVGAGGAAHAGGGGRARKGMTTTQKAVAAAVAVILVAAGVVGAYAILGRPRVTGGPLPATSGSAQLVPEDLTFTGVVSAHLTEARASCHSGGGQGFNAGIHFNRPDNLRLFLIAPEGSGPGPYKALQPMGNGQSVDTISVRTSGGDSIASLANRDAITFTVNPDGLSGTVDAVLADSGNPTGTSNGHVKGTWRCVPGSLQDSAPDE
ncbi:MAG: eukaryotic-like serine/threonine-protein kinase [Chloroflexota bacterium]|jgi:tRNA A-37 threonylcarbamoyl transferase component Bud32|nr:eukaryotic-like serine/threonine-protein kinase [Chloroflexota bacterium]